MQAWDHANDNFFFKLGAVMDRSHFLGYGALHSSMDHTEYNGVV